MRGGRWSAADDARLRAARQAGQTVTDIAILLGRSQGAIKFRCKVMGIAAAQIPGARARSWPEHRLAEARALLSSGMTHRAAAAAMGVTLCSFGSAMRFHTPGKPGVVKPAPTTTGRSCLRCRRVFAAQHRGNRICGICKLSDDWVSGAGTDMPLSGARIGK